MTPRQVRAVVMAAFVAIGAMLLLLIATADKRGSTGSSSSSSSSSALVTAVPSTTSIASSDASVAAMASMPPIPSSTPPPVDAAAGLVLGGAWSADRDAIESALARKDISALPVLEVVDLTKNGYVAASAISAVATLAPLAPEADRLRAIATLARWLSQENARKTPDARGNVSILVDALGDTKSKEAAAPLIATLDVGDQPIHLETRIVQVLGQLGDKSAEASVQRWVTRVAAKTAADDYERELIREALAAGAATLAALEKLP